MKWISVEDELPPHRLSLLYWRPIDHEERPYHKAMIVGSMSFASKDDVWAEGRYIDISTHITHWMPLPEPPTK